MAKTLIPNKGQKINIKNKRAEHDYLLMDKFTAGIQLTGTEIKSIRAGKASLVDTFCYENRGEMWVKNMYVAHYEQGRTTTMWSAVTASYCSTARRYARFSRRSRIPVSASSPPCSS